MDCIQFDISLKRLFFSLFKTVCHLTWQPFLVTLTFPVQWKRHTSTDYNSISWLHAVEHRIIFFTLGDHKRNLDKFLVLADAKSLSDSAVTIFVQSTCLNATEE